VAQHVRTLGGQVLAEEAHSDLNDALCEGRELLAHEADYLLILPSDLPLISAEIIQSLLTTPNAVVCSDRHGTGTNALLIPSQLDFAFQFGPNSFHKHRHQLTELGVPHIALTIPQIAFDLDTPDDYRQWQEMLIYK